MSISMGQLKVPSGWETRTQVTFLEPVDAGLKVPLATQQTAPKPRGNIVVSRHKADSGTAAEAMEQFMAQTGQAIPGLKKLGQSSLAFGDGVKGESVTISFHATPQVRLAQRHVFRVDAGVLTQLVATVEEHRAGDLEGSLAQLMMTFRP